MPPTEASGGGTSEIDDQGEGAASAEHGMGSAPEEGTRDEDDVPRGMAVQAASDGGGAPVATDPSTLAASLGAGRPLAEPVRTKMESFFGHEFSDVRIHADAHAGNVSRALSASAFTVGEHVAFAPSRYQPDAPEGQRLLAHELTHVLQQRRGLSGTILRDGIGRGGDQWEREAERSADRYAAGACRPEPSSQVTGAAGGSSTAAVQLYSASGAVSYARKWALSTNPRYPRFGNDCTNFASQTMFEGGGWSMVTGICGRYRSDDVWWYGATDCECWFPFAGCIRASHTWGGAHNFHQFVKNSGRGTLKGNVHELEEGDVLQRDRGDGHMGHTMIVTKKGTDVVDGSSIVQLWLSYHTSDHLDEPFWGTGNILDRTPSGYQYYAFHIT